MSIDEILKQLMEDSWLAANNEVVTTRRTEKIREAMQKVARDQRHICAEALLDVPGDGNFKIDRDNAHQAVMNATLK